MGVSENSGTPKWMVKIMENPIRMDDLGGKPTIFGNPHIDLGWWKISIVTHIFSGRVETINYLGT